VTKGYLRLKEENWKNVYYVYHALPHPPGRNDTGILTSEDKLNFIEEDMGISYTATSCR